MTKRMDCNAFVKECEVEYARPSIGRGWTSLPHWDSGVELFQALIYFAENMSSAETMRYM